MSRFQGTGKGERGLCEIHEIPLKQRKDKNGFFCTICAGIETQSRR